MLKSRLLREHLCGQSKKRKVRRDSGCGSEAVAAAVLTNLQAADALILAEPDPLPALVKGVSLEAILRRHPAPAGAVSTNVQDAYTACGVVVAPFPDGACTCGAGATAAGAAFANKLTRRGHVSVVFFCDSDANSSWQQALDFAMTCDLPLVFIRQSASPFQPARHNRGRRGARSGKAPTLPMIPVDSNDAVAVFRVAHEAIGHARRGNGPTLIDCVSLRMPGEQAADPIARMETCLAGRGIRPQKIASKVAAEFNRTLNAAVKAATRSPRKIGK